MPKAFGQKYHYLDHDSDYVSLNPPVQNTWYEVFHAYDTRLLICAFYQTNGEAAAKWIEVRWTIDGNAYVCRYQANDSQYMTVFRHFFVAGATQGLAGDIGFRNAGSYADKRGQDFKVEIRITDAVGTNQTLECWCVRETLELT